MKNYSWSIEGFYKQDANEVGKELEKIEDDLTPDNVINLARDENSVLHDIFEWNDTIAGEKYRKIQANKLIHNIQVTIIPDKETTETITKAFVTVKRDSKYEPIEKVVKDVDKYALLLNRAYKELNGIKRRYDNLIEIQELLADIPETN